MKPVPIQPADDVALGAEDVDTPSVGEAVRRLRKAKGMTLQELASASGVSVGMLSQVERNLSSPSVRVLAGIRRALDAPISALFDESDERADDPSFLRRQGARPMINLGELRKELLSTTGAHNLQMMILHIEPGGTSGDQPLSYPAEKGGYMLAGDLLLRVGEEESILKEGDSFVFDSLQPHSFRNVGSIAAKVLWIIGAVPLERHL